MSKRPRAGSISSETVLTEQEASKSRYFDLEELWTKGKKLCTSLFIDSDDLGQLPSSTSTAPPPLATNVPAEILIEIFSGLSFEDKLACQATCRRWNNVVTYEPRLWNDYPLLKGTLTQMDAQWKILTLRLQGHGVRSLIIELSKNALPKDINCGWDDLRYLNTVEFLKTFPFDTLEELYYYSSKEESVNEYIWAKVTKCSQLKSLFWNASPLLYYHTEPFIYEIENTSLHQCRLEEFSIKGDHNCRLDRCFAQLLSKAKVIEIGVLLQYWRIRRILVAAKDTLEEFYLREVISHPAELEAEQPDIQQGDNANSTIEMPNLRKYIAKAGLCPDEKDRERTDDATFNIIAPRLQELDVYGYLMMDYTLLRSCQSSLVSLDCVAIQCLNSIEERQLLCMPQCQHLVLWNCECLLKWIPTTGNRLNHDQDTTGQDIMLDQVLPKLKRLYIKNDSQFTGQQLLNWMQQRSRWKINTIQEILLRACPRVSLESVAKLELMIPNIVHSKAVLAFRPRRHHRARNNGSDDDEEEDNVD